MSLPTPPVPRFDLIVPSTGKKLSYRPYLVGEQTVILNAMAIEDPDALNNAIEDVVKACTFGEFDVSASPVYDVEYVLLMIRSKSSGEVIEQVYKCRNMVDLPKAEGQPAGVGSERVVCGSKVMVDVDVRGAEVVRPDGHEMTIMLSDEIGLKMRDLPYGTWREATKDGALNATTEVLASCIESVFTADAVHTRKDFEDAELVRFIEGFWSGSFTKLEKFFLTMPYLGQTVKLRCPKCGTVSEVEIKGLDDFLT